MLFFLFFLLSPDQTLQNPKEHLLQTPLEQVFIKKDFALFGKICTEKVAVHCDSPLPINGYFFNWSMNEKFLTAAHFLVVEKLEWTGFFVDEERAIESLNSVIVDTRNGTTYSYKFIIFLLHNSENEWKIYYLRGIKI